MPGGFYSGTASCTRRVVVVVLCRAVVVGGREGRPRVRRCIYPSTNGPKRTRCSLVRETDWMLAWPVPRPGGCHSGEPVEL